MSIISPGPETIKTSKGFDESDIDVTATELLGLRELVVESYAIDEAKQESRFYCCIHFDCVICPRCYTNGEED